MMLLDGCERVRCCMCMQTMLAPLHQGMSQGGVIHEKDSRGLLDFVMGSAFGKGSLLTFILLLMHPQQSPPAVCVTCVADPSLLTASAGARGAGAVVVLLVLLLLKAPWRKSKQSPLLKVYRHD